MSGPVPGAGEPVAWACRWADDMQATPYVRLGPHNEDECAADHHIPWFAADQLRAAVDAAERRGHDAERDAVVAWLQMACDHFRDMPQPDEESEVARSVSMLAMQQVMAVLQRDAHRAP